MTLGATWVSWYLPMAGSNSSLSIITPASEFLLAFTSNQGFENRTAHDVPCERFGASAKCLNPGWLVSPRVSSGAISKRSCGTPERPADREHTEKYAAVRTRSERFYGGNEILRNSGLA